MALLAAGPVVLAGLFVLPSRMGWLPSAVALGGALVLLGVAWRAYRWWAPHSLHARAVRLSKQPPPVNEFTAIDEWSSELGRLVSRAEPGTASVGREIVLARIDADGRAQPIFGDLPDMVHVNQADFAPRQRFPLDVVLLDGRVLVRKDFRGNRERFAREWHNLEVLRNRANVPAVYRADTAATVLYKNLIAGRTLRDVLVEAGAGILSVHTRDDPALSGLKGEARLNAVLARGTERLRECFTNDFLRRLEAQMDAVHACAIAGLSLTFGNVMVDRRGDPWLIDLEGSRAFSSTKSLAFAYHRDRDRERFNQIYGQSVLTERTARQKLACLAQQGPGWYAPIDFGGGLSVDGFWSVDSGTGRWEYLNRQVLRPLLPGQRVLDLGSNNGVMPLMMLREGAREVVGLELDADLVERARWVQRLFEWRDMRRYSFDLRTADMRAILSGDWGTFDIVTAFCSLYYLEPDDMAQMVRRAAELASTMVVQAKTDTRTEAADHKAEKSSIAFLRELLLVGGFEHVSIHAPRGYSRPLLVARRD